MIYNNNNLPEFFRFIVNNGESEITYHAINQRDNSGKVIIGWQLQGKGLCTSYPINYVIKFLNTSSWNILE